MYSLEFREKAYGHRAEWKLKRKSSRRGLTRLVAAHGGGFYTAGAARSTIIRAGVNSRDKKLPGVLPDSLSFEYAPQDFLTSLGTGTNLGP